MIRTGVVWLGVAMLLVACGEATFVAPTSPSVPNRVLPVAPVAVTPVVPINRITQNFRQNRPQGTLNIAFIVRVNPESENLNKIFLPRLRYLARNLGQRELRWPGVPALRSYEKIRTTILLEKNSELDQAGSTWSVHDGSRPETELREQFERQVIRLEANLDKLKDEAYSTSPFDSMGKVARSFSSKVDAGPSYLHLVYLTDRDIFLNPAELESSQQALRKQLQRNYVRVNATTVSVLSYQDENSTCKPHQNDVLDETMKTQFKLLSGSFHELCDIPRESITQLLNLWVQEHRKVSLWFPPQPGTTIEVKVNGTAISSRNFRLNGKVIEWLGTNPADGSAIEVTYEAQY